MDREHVMKLRDQKQLHTLQEAFEEIQRAKCNQIDLGDGYSLTFDLKLRGFVAVCGTQQGSQLMCPVMKCQSYSAGGHNCEHGVYFIDHLKRKQ